MKFDLEKELLNWKKKLSTSSAFESGDIIEYEIHLRDHIEQLIEDGFSEEEAFKKAVNNFGKTNTLAKEMTEVIKSPQKIRRMNHKIELSIISLLPNYLKTTTRNLLRNKFYALINVVSISLGIVVCSLILQYYFFETNQDQFHDRADDIYRVVVESYNNVGSLSFTTALNFPGTVEALNEEATSVESAVSLTGAGTIFRKDNNVIQENSLFYVSGSSVFDVFTIEIIYGDHTDLDLPATMFISDSLSNRYFGNRNPVGENIELIDVIGEWQEFEVRGVYKSIPELSHIQPEALLNGTNNVRLTTDSGAFGPIPYDDIVWRLRNNFTYIKAFEGVSLDQLNNDLATIQEKYRKPFDLRQGIESRFKVQPLVDIHLTQDILNEPTQVADMQSLNLILMIGIAALLIGWVNYINLATARSINRAREIGIRKVLGSSKKQLIVQFVLESVFLNLIAAIFSVAIILYVIPYFQDVLNQNIFDYFSYFSDKWMLFIGLLFLGMIISGFYPAFIFSRYKPITTLKGAFKNSKQGVSLRKLLVTMQFSLSLFLLISIFVVQNQLGHMRDLDKGLNMSQTYVFNPPTFLEGNPLDRFELLKQELEQIPGITKVTNSTVVPGNAAFSAVMGEKLVNQGNEERITLNYSRIQYDYFDHYEIELKAGRFFDEDRSGEDSKVILNESAISLLGFNSSEEAINKELYINLGDTLEIVGVVKNYAQQSLQQDYIPMIFVTPAESGFVSGMGPTSLKINTADVSSVISRIEGVFADQFPGDIFNGFFLEDQFDELYATEDQFGIIFSTFTFVSVLITILGLIGLSSFMIGQKRKEIGIRKVLGSSTTEILTLILSDYLKLVLFSSILSIPFAIWWYINWLQNFPFTFSPNVFTIAIPLIILLGITLIAILNQSLRAALTKPVKSLRTE